MSFSGIGFGHGLPSHGSTVSVSISGQLLMVEGWPEVLEIPVTDIVARVQGDKIVFEWLEQGHHFAVSIDDTDAGRKHFLESISLTKNKQDAPTRRWLTISFFILFVFPVALMLGYLTFEEQIIDAVTSQITAEQEAEWLLGGFKVESLPIIKGTAANRFVEETGKRLVAAAPSNYKYQFFIVADKEVNAFAMPGGIVVVNSGFLLRMDSADQVAAVLAHEIAHVEKRHSLRRYLQEKGFSAMVRIVTTGFGSLRAAGNLAQTFSGLRYSRGEESEADAVGYERLIQAQMNPRGMQMLLDTLAKIQEGKVDIPAFLSTHPASAERAASIERRLKGAPNYHALETNWSEIKNSLPEINHVKREPNG